MISIFIGAKGTGKTKAILNIAAALSCMGKRVLVIDTTEDKKIIDAFNFNSTENVLDFERNNYDVKIIKLNNLKQLDEFKNYDHILVKADEQTNLDSLDENYLYVLVQNQDKKTLKINGQLLLRMKDIQPKKQILIFNDYVESKFTREYIYDKLSAANVGFLYSSIQVEFPFREEDYRSAIDNQLDGFITLSKYSNEYKKALFDVVFAMDESIIAKEFSKKLK